MSPTRRVLSQWTLGIPHTTHCGLCVVVYVASWERDLENSCPQLARQQHILWLRSKDLGSNPSPPHTGCMLFLASLHISRAGIVINHLVGLL